MARSIPGSPGTDPEQRSAIALAGPATTSSPDGPGRTDTSAIAAPVTPAAGMASVIIGDGAAYVEVDGRRGRLSAGDVARLGALTAASARQETIGGPLAKAIAAARANEAALLSLPNVISVRAGFKFVEGMITSLPAVVVAVDRKRDDLPPYAVIPAVLPDGTPTDVAIADPLDRLRRADGAEASGVLPGLGLLIEQVQADGETMLEAVRPITYRPPAGATLAPVSGAMTVVCHVSPDAGWKVLRPFLAATRTSITLGMYDFTAPHIFKVARDLLRGSHVRWRQTLDPGESLPKSADSDSTKAEDKPEAWINTALGRAGGDNFETAFARTGAGRTFASAYHIKVAIRDNEAIWLSSGNWQSSNQPAIDFLEPDADLRVIRDYNREWHMVIESPELAARFHAYVDDDHQMAREGDEAAVVPGPTGPDLLLPTGAEDEPARDELQAFAPLRLTFTAAQPLTVQPILTPDNYLDIVLELLRRRPTSRLYFQNQSLNPVLAPTARWAELLDLLAEYSRAESLDVRIILRNIGPVRKKLESLQLAGFRMDRIRMQEGCHTKGIVVDGSTVLLGSHNWTNEGVESNRDASLLIHHEEIAEYYERVFLHDWDRLSRPSIREEATPVPVEPDDEAGGAIDAAVSRGARLISWTDWMEV